MAQVIFGVDVAKGWIDAQRRGGKPERIAMEEAALCGFAERAARERAPRHRLPVRPRRECSQPRARAPARL